VFKDGVGYDPVKLTESVQASWVFARARVVSVVSPRVNRDMLHAGCGPFARHVHVIGKYMNCNL